MVNKILLHLSVVSEYILLSQLDLIESLHSSVWSSFPSTYHSITTGYRGGCCCCSVEQNPNWNNMKFFQFTKNLNLVSRNQCSCALSTTPIAVENLDFKMEYCYYNDYNTKTI